MAGDFGLDAIQNPVSAASAQETSCEKKKKQSKQLSN